MQCPVCSAELESGAVVCPSCGAMRVTSASPAGAIVGWVGVLVAVMVGCLWAIALVIPLFGVSLRDFPWAVLFIGTGLAVGLLWYSRSTRQPRWIPR